MVNASKAGNDVPRHITAKIREDGGVKKSLLPYVAMRSAEFIFNSLASFIPPLLDSKTCATKGSSDCYELHLCFNIK